MRRWFSGFRRAAAAAAAALILLSALAGCGNPRLDLPLSQRITNMEEIIASVRQGLRGHARSITITFDYGSDIFEELNGVIGAWMEEALAETDAPDEGDYLRYQSGGYTYNSSYTIEDGRWRYTVRLTPDYYTYLSQEEQVTQAVEEILDDMAFRRSTSDYEKIRAIYDYLCANVAYDKVHQKNPYSHLKSTAYAALIQHTATCQGYCTALYRLLRESGIECRIVTGTASGEEGVEKHAWVIAALDGQYYNLDPTWDAGSEEYRFFLLGERAFADHLRGEEFETEAFRTRYPMAETSYIP